MKLFLCFLMLSISTICVYAQDTILFMDGKTKVCKVQIVDDAKEIVVYNQGDDRKYIYAKTYEKYEVMYVRFGNTGRKRYIYTYDTTIGNYLRVKDMERFVLGEQYGSKYFHTPMSILFGAVVSAAGVVGLEAAGISGFYSLATAPFCYFLVNIKRGRKPQDKGLAKYPPSLISNQFFINGYREMAKRKKSRMALLGGLAGAIGAAMLIK